MTVLKTPVRFRDAAFGACLALGFFASAPDALARTIRIPEEYATLKEGVEAARNGDVLSLAPQGYESSDIRIANKRLAIEGRDANDLSRASAKPFVSHEACFIIQDATVSMSNLHIWAGNTLNGWPAIVIENASLSFANCTIDGNSGSGGAAGGDSRSNTPALIVRNCTRRTIALTDCRLSTKNHFPRSQTPIGAVAVSNCADCDFTFLRCGLQGADGIEAGGHFNDVFTKGSPGIAVSQSNRIHLNLTDSNLQGGKSAKWQRWQRSGTDPYTRPPLQGSTALWIDGSSVSIRGGALKGGTGGDGGAQIYDGAPGGCGLHVQNNSYVSITDARLTPGPGGEPNGPLGEPYFVDDSSTVDFLSHSKDWRLYR